MDETRPGDRPTRTVRWGREASTDHSHEDGARAVDAVRLTPQDLQPTRHRRVPAPHRPATTARNCETRVVTTDLESSAEDLVARYASRWGIEQAFADARQIVGVGEARNRTRRAVERTVPFGLICFSVVTLWYALHGHAPA